MNRVRRGGALILAALLAWTGLAQAKSPNALLAACLAEHSEVGLCKGVIYEPCLELAERQSTVGQASCYREEGEAWDAVLNADYQHLMSALTPEQQDALRGAQRAWIAYRDADCGFIHPLVEGTFAQVWGSVCFAHATADRVGKLRGYLDFIGR